MKKLTSIALALIMAATVYAVPAAGVYAEDQASDNVYSEEANTEYDPTAPRVMTNEEAEPEGDQLVKGTGDNLGDTSSASSSASSSSTTKTTTTKATTTTKPTTTAAPKPTKPGKVPHFASISRTANSITLEFDSAKNAKMYKIYRKKDGEWKKVVTIVSDKREYTVKKLKSAKGYRFKIVPYNVSKDKKVSVKGKATFLRTATRPGKVKLVSVSKKFPTLKAKWEKKKGSGYEIWVSTSPKFKSKKKIFVKKQSKLTKKLGALKNGKKYYVKVRAIYKYNNKTYKGKWSKTKACKVKSTGWYKKKGRQYYYKNGDTIKGYHKFNGTRLYFLKSTGELVGISPTMWKKVKGHSSRTKYFVAVSKKYNRFVVYKDYDSHWCVYKYGPCTTGKPSTPSPSGYFSTTGRDKLSFGSGFTCWYATNISGQVYFHSVICAQGTKYASGGQLGRSLSHGCIRLSLGNAYWIYKNIGKGTKVVIY